VTVPWFRGLISDLSPLWPGFAPGSLHVGFVVDKVALGQVFLRVLRLSRVNIIPPWLSILIYHLRINNRPVGGCSSETLFHPIDMNNNIESIKITLKIF
jgi:hypothetical protein